MSGGGLWNIVQNPDNEFSYYLIGVIYYQSALIDNKRTISCYGSRSIETLLNRSKVK